MSMPWRKIAQFLKWLVGDTSQPNDLYEDYDPDDGNWYDLYHKDANRFGTFREEEEDDYERDRIDDFLDRLDEFCQKYRIYDFFEGLDAFCLRIAKFLLGDWGDE